MQGAPGIVQVYNVLVSEANKFYNVDYPENCFINHITVQAREKATVKIRFNGKEEVLTLKPFGVYWEENIKYHSMIEVSSETPNVTVEVVLWMERV